MKAPANESSFFTSRPVAILMVFLAAVVFGYLSYGRLPLTLMPELTYPTITVRTEYPGAAPEEVENDISRPVEEALGVIAGLKKLSSISRAGISDVVLEFAWDTEMSEATQDVLEKLDLVFLPDETKRPLILHYDPSLDPVMELSLSGRGKRFEGEQGLRRLRRLADLQIKKSLEPVKGIAAVRIRGGLEEEIHVLLDEASLRRTNMPIQRVIDRLAQENINVAGGTLKEGRIEYLVRTLNEYENLDQIADTIVASLEGRDVRIKDLGRVVRSHKEREIVTRTDGGPSVQIEIFKEGDANIVALAKRVRAMLGEFDPDAKEEEAAPAVATAEAGPRGGPPRPVGMAESLFRTEGARLQLVADRSLFIESSVREVRNTAVLGGLLAIVVLYLFLRRSRSTAIIAVSIPISLLITFAPLNLLGVSLNIMSLGGLALGIGMLVDSSIVVLESIYRCREEGDGVAGAAVRGTSEVRSAVLASTLTSIAVFFPMVFVEGIAGQAFGDLGFAVVVSLLASAAVALFFIPMLAARTGMGLAVVFAVGAVMLLAFLSSSVPQIANIVFGVVAVLLVIGLLYVVVLAVRGKLGLDDYTKRSMGLWRITSWRRLRESIRAPVNAFAVPFVRSLAERSRMVRIVRVALLPVLLVVGAVFFALSCLYVYVVRFLLGFVFEWGIGKPLILGVLGLGSLLARHVVPFFALLFRVLFWAPLKLTGGIMGGLARAYPALLRSALAHPIVVVAVVLACLWGTWQVVGGLDSELLPEVHQGEFTVEVKLPVGTPLEATEAVVTPVEQVILEEREHIRSLLLTVGYDSATSQRSDEGEHTARFKVLLEDGNRNVATEAAVVARLRERFSGIPDLEARIVRPVLFSSKTPIEVEVHGDDLQKLRRYADRSQAVMAALPELADVETSLQSGAPEVQIVYDRDRLSRYGLNILEVARLVRDKVKGYEATRFNLKDRRIPILVRLDLADRETVDDVRGIIINPGAQRPIRLAAIADVTLGEGPSEVRRIDGRRVAVVSANIASGSLSGATARIEERLHAAIDWPGEMTFLIGGQNEEWQRSQRSLWIALALSIFLVYVIMAAQFESLLHPLVIMLTIPLAFVGTVLTLKLLGLSLSIVVFLGMIMLAGIVVNNAIVLVDYINTLRRRGLERDEAIVTAGEVRLRPILMTTATTVLGLTPMALGLGDGAEIRTPMAIAVISGLLSSTALTLVVIPSIYALVDTMKRGLLGGRDRVVQVEPAAAAVSGTGSGAVTP